MAAGIAMVLAVSALRPWLQGPEAVRTAALIAAGSVVYIGLLTVAFRSWAAEFVSLAGTLRSRAQ